MVSCALSCIAQSELQPSWRRGAGALAPALAANGALTTVSLTGNKLGDEGWGAICGSMDSKIMSMDASSEDIGPAGVKLIAEVLRTSVTGALTSVKIRGNELRDEGWGAIFAAICGNKDSKIVSMDASSENISPAGVKLILLCNCKALQGKAGFKLHFCDACACCLGFVIIAMCLLLVQGLIIVKVARN